MSLIVLLLSPSVQKQIVFLFTPSQHLQSNEYYLSIPAFFSKKAAKRWAPSLVQLQLENPCNLKPITSPSTSISFPASSPTTSEHERFLGKRGKPFLGHLGSSGAWDLGWASMLRLGHWVLAPLPAPALLPAALPKHEGFLPGVWALVHQWQHTELPAGTWTLFSLSTCFDAALQ